MSTTVDPARVRAGRVRGRYFRENFAQGGLDLAQVVAELVTNADAAIAAAGRGRGSITLRFGAGAREFRRTWKRELTRLRVPDLPDWQHEVVCTDNGEGLDWETVERRLGALGVEPARAGQRGLFGRGLRDVWLAQGGGRLQAIRAGRAVEAWFFPASGDEPYAFAPVLEEAATPELRRAFGIEADGTRVTVPLALPRLPSPGRLRSLVAQLVQLRPVLEDPGRELWLELDDEPLQLITAASPELDPARPTLFDGDVDVRPGVAARVVVRRALAPIPLGSSRATRRGGLLIRSGRAAHEATLLGYENRQGSRHLFGEIRCEEIESLQRDALESRRPEVVVKVDRSGLNENHPFVISLHAAVERVLRPLVEAEERRAGAHLLSTGRAIKARDEVGLRALNDALKAAFDAPGSAGFARGAAVSDEAPRETLAADVEPGARDPVTQELESPDEAMRFKQSPLRMHPSEQRTVSLLFDPARVPPGTGIETLADDGLGLTLSRDDVPDPGKLGWSRVSGSLRARASANPGSRLTVVAQAGEHTAELEVLIVQHRASGWVREIARKDEDAQIEASFDPETGVVTVFEGRKEFKSLERGARRSGLSKRRVPEYLPFRLLEVEVAANAVYAWAAERIVERRLAEARPAEPSDYAAAVRNEAQLLRHRFHERLMRAFLEPEVFDGGVSVGRAPVPRDETPQQTSLLPVE
ncbi:MAG: hypothetical protein MSC30_08055 [Gaiellaceae bacterium MAG52_C11]|nr:hypothetical protein [Candidatus Gaiellasilicea maunaloa]